MRSTEGLEGVEDPAAALAQLRGLVERTRPVTTADQRLLPVLPVLEDLLPMRGLRRGTVVQVDGTVGATSLALAVAAGPTRAGSWAACIGTDELGWSAAAEVGVDLDRLVVVRATPPTWATATAALVDAVDVVVCGPGHAPSAVEARRLQARARERGAVLVVLGARRTGSNSAGSGSAGSGSAGSGSVGSGSGAAGPSVVRRSRRPWPGAADLDLTVVDARWQGLGQGWGHLRSRLVTIEVTGRRGADRPRRVELLLPGPTGAPAAASPAGAAPAGVGSSAGAVPDRAADPTRDAPPARRGEGPRVVPLRRTG